MSPPNESILNALCTILAASALFIYHIRCKLEFALHFSAGLMLYAIASIVLNIAHLVEFNNWLTLGILGTTCIIIASIFEKTEFHRKILALTKQKQ